MLCDSWGTAGGTREGVNLHLIELGRVMWLGEILGHGLSKKEGVSRQPPPVIIEASIEGDLFCVSLALSALLSSSSAHVPQPPSSETLSCHHPDWLPVNPAHAARCPLPFAFLQL